MNLHLRFVRIHSSVSLEVNDGARMRIQYFRRSWPPQSWPYAEVYSSTVCHQPPAFLIRCRAFQPRDPIRIAQTTQACSCFVQHFSPLPSSSSLQAHSERLACTCLPPPSRLSPVLEAIYLRVEVLLADVVKGPRNYTFTG